MTKPFQRLSMAACLVREIAAVTPRSKAHDSFQIEVVGRMYAGVFRGPRLNAGVFRFALEAIIVKPWRRGKHDLQTKRPPKRRSLRYLCETEGRAVAPAAVGAVSSSRVSNSEFVDALAGRKQFAQPARLCASAGPSLGGFGRILEFRINLGVGTATPHHC